MRVKQLNLENIKISKFDTWWFWNVSERFWRVKYFWGIRHLLKFRLWVSNLLFPRQKWLMNGITRGWMDKTSIIPQVLFNCVVHFVEKNGEDCFNVINWDSDNSHAACRDFLRDCYKYITEERPALEKELSELLGIGYKRHTKNGLDDFNSSKSYKDFYKEYDKIDRELEDKDSFYLQNIIKYRNYLWT